MAQNIYVGNADVDGPLNRGWLLGHFMPEGDVRHSEDVEIKWGVHPAGEERAQWVTREERTSLHVLISGRFEIRLPDRTVELARPGDYVVLHQHRPLVALGRALGGAERPLAVRPRLRGTGSARQAVPGNAAP